jgi:CRISPR-associated protein Cmr1
MPPLEFELQLITPAFVGGVPKGSYQVSYLQKDHTGIYQHGTKEVALHPVDPAGLRIPSLRGVLEFWQRSRFGHLSPEQVFQRQQRIFGSVNVGQGVRFRALSQTDFERDKLVYKKNCYAFVYLGYGPLQILRVPSGRPDGEEIATSYNRSQCRDAILPGARARFRFLASGTRGQCEELQRSLILLHLFGGLGSRSRRGWGSVQVEAGFLGSPPAAGSLKDWFEEMLARAWEPADPSASGISPRFSALSGRTQIFLTREFPSHEDVLLEFYRRFQRVRSWRAHVPNAVQDHAFEINDAGQSEDAISGVPVRLAFGLPYQPGHFRRWSIEYRGRHPERGVDESDDVMRRASPLLLKVFQRGHGRYVGVVLFLEADFFADSRMEIGAVGKHRTLPFPGYGVVQEFLDNPDWTAVRVPGSA